jgi:hypothetical protein
MQAIIYKPAKTAMQSGVAKTKKWVLEFLPVAPKYVEPLMGWIGSRDTQQQVKLYFSSIEEAEQYAKNNEIVYSIRVEQKRSHLPKSYADNFKWN